MPITLNNCIGEIPFPGLLIVKFLVVNFSPFLISLAATIEVLAILIFFFSLSEIFLTKNLNENLDKLNGEFKENPLVKEVINFITKDKKRSICTPFSKE